MALFPCHHWGRGQRPSQLHYLTYEVTLGVNIGQRIENTEDQVCVSGEGLHGQGLGFTDIKG